MRKREVPAALNTQNNQLTSSSASASDTSDDGKLAEAAGAAQLDMDNGWALVRVKHRALATKGKQRMLPKGTVLFCYTPQFCTVQYSTVLHCTTLHCTTLSVVSCGVHQIALYH